MKIQIEAPIDEKTLTAIPILELTEIINFALEAKAMPELREFISIRSYKCFKVGFGGYHCWVRQIGSDGNLIYNRNTLTITE